MTGCGKLLRSWAFGSELFKRELYSGRVLTYTWNANSLKNHGADEEVHEMFEMGRETMDLPLEEKMKFEQGDSGLSAG